MADSSAKRLRLEMSEEMLSRLLTIGQVCAADFRCLDCESKQCLWRLCLESCATNVTCGMGTQSGHNGWCRVCGRTKKPH
jgi:hypothetical protein